MHSYANPTELELVFSFLLCHFFIAAFQRYALSHFSTLSQIVRDLLGLTIHEKRGEPPPFGGFLLTFFGWVLGQFQAELVVSADVSSIETGRLVDQAQRERSPVRGSS